MITLTLCARCGYKMLSPGSDDPENIRTAKKIAQGEKFHFALKPLDECPRDDCLHNLKNDRAEVSDEDVQRAIGVIDKGSRCIADIRKSIDGANTMLERFPSIDRFTAFFENLKACGVDTGVTFRELQSVIEEYRETVNEFAADLTKLHERLIK